MSELLKTGQILKTTSSTCKVISFLGGGGQGEVYKVDLNGKSLALKWYFPSSATNEQLSILARLIKIGAPTERFLWPMEITKTDNMQGFGYIMPLRESNYKNINDLMKRRIDPSFRALAVAGFELSDSFLQLHSKGLCYRDISFGNVFFDPHKGDILICDNDNVAFNGDKIGGVLGTPGFMAPEVVRGDADPSTQTDLFSLGVLLFYLLMVHHPLKGKKEAAIKSFDLPAQTRIFGIEPIFIFDPDNDSNRPVQGYQDNALIYWPIYPIFLQNLFIKTFTNGIKDPHDRVRESEWRLGMIRLLDSIIYCPCGAENFYDADFTKNSGGSPKPCWSCKKPIQLPPQICINKNIVLLNSNTKLFPHHIDDERQYDFTKPVAEVTQHPTNPNMWGIKNLSNEKWVTTNASGKMSDVEPGRNVQISKGTKINFGKTEGEIVI